MTFPRTLDESTELLPNETLAQWRRRVKPAKRTRRLFWASLYDRMTEGR